MLEITFLQGLWFVLIAILIVGYFILDGLDLGIGVLYPFIQKSEMQNLVEKPYTLAQWLQ